MCINEDSDLSILGICFTEIKQYNKVAVELIEIRSRSLEVPGMEVDDLKEILEFICTG